MGLFVFGKFGVDGGIFCWDAGVVERELCRVSGGVQATYNGKVFK